MKVAAGLGLDGSGNLYAADLSGFDVVYVWATAYARLQEVVRTMRPGSRLVSYHTPVAGLEPTAVDEGGMRPIFTYVIE